MSSKEIDEEYIQKMLKNIDNESVRKVINDEITLLVLAYKDKDVMKNLLNAMMQYPDSVKEIEKNWRNIINNYEDGIEFIEVFGNDEQISKEILNNVPWLINYSNCYDTGKITYELAKLNNSDQVIFDNFDELSKYCRSHYADLYAPLMNSEEGIAKLRNNLNDLKKYIDPKEFFDIIKRMENNEALSDEYEKYYFWADLYDKVVLPEDDISTKHFKERSFGIIINSNDEIREEKKMILESLAKEENDTYSYQSNGYFSLVLKIGDKIVKIGKKEKYDIPYSPYIMMPKFRKKYNDETTLEVFDMGEIEKTDVAEEKVLEILEKLDEAGIFWADPKAENIVKLKKDNTIPDYIKSEDFNVLGFLKDDRYSTTNHTVLKAEDYVICDLDYIFAKDDPEIKDFFIKRVEDYKKDIKERCKRKLNDDDAR